MTRTITAAAAAVCSAGIAYAQYTMDWRWTVSDTGNEDGIIEPGEHALLALLAAWDGPPPVYYAGSVFEILGVSGWNKGTLLVADGNDTFGQLTNEDGVPQPNNDILAIDTFQLPRFFNPQFWEGNPVVVYWIEWVPDDYSPRTVSGTSANHLNHSLYIDDFGTSVEATPTIEGFSFQVVPAPASVALLASGVVCAGRRRRS
ncbi:MAG: PEP-CTERM sorting domain-containing protein [Leptolyngbya sp. PLA2]|nr:PEP-CTERM sorting domain-containing protein [Leptolyngbya sp.]MCE7971213.1 PEP-CTERM sorting domain-containing protein [Leptolyngbya sp. PL-A2]MCQ3940892.1 hypothetical protein [cyanobacterium CYA1]MCZ7634071.1 PEP-CTERM sorting domain-containing protein [Phycisphaerales bacterium]MDL1905206.1 PEP-CTERM sorting domain-containing protein [Synechococcales cyanobacterium CNB]GIK19244.1 MAG: hypothetical protein BroJett004_14080 [Planctomycetota bacterium]